MDIWEDLGVYFSLCMSLNLNTNAKIEADLSMKKKT